MGLYSRRNIIIGTFLLAFLLVGLGASYYLVGKKQDIRNQASSSVGTATITVSPATGNIATGGTLPITISFNTAGNIISAIATRLSFSYSGSISDLSASQIQIDPALLADGDWTCPVRQFAADSGKANIDIACANTDLTGFSASSVTSLATITLAASPSAVNQTFVLTFDPTESIITKKSDSSDVLLTPASQGTYTITGGVVATVTPTPVPTPTPVVPVTRRYRCQGYSCVEDDVSGSFVTANCGNTCSIGSATSGQPKLPQTGNTETTAIMLVFGVILITTAIFLFPIP